MTADNAKYHVSARINRKEMILDAPRMKLLFLEVVSRAKTKYKFEIENFTIMGNHFHFIIKPGHAVSLSRIMQWILSVFAQTFNRMHDLTGHVWGERFFSRIIANLREYTGIFDYIDNNPVRAGLVVRADLWEYGGLFFRRTGTKGILSPLPDILRLFFPLHNVCLIECNTNN